MRRVVSRLQGAFTLVAADAAGPGPGGRGAAQLAAGRRDRRGRELPRLRRRRVHRAHPRGDGARPGPGRHDHPRRRVGRRLRRHARRGPALPRDLGPVGRREGRPRLVHAQGDLRAAARRGRLAARAAVRPRGACTSTRCGSPTRSCATSTRSSSSRAARRSTPAWSRSTRSSTGPGSPVEVELASEFRYRDPILTSSTLVVAISQSGETADTLQAIRHARRAALARCWRSATPTARRSRASPTR